LPKNAFARNVGVLVSGTAGAQFLMVLAAPLLTRLYSPEDFGLLAVYGGLLALFTVIAGLRYELAIPLPESNTEAANVLVLSLVMVLLTTAISALMVYLVGHELVLALNAPELGRFFWLLPIGVLLSGVYNVFNYWAVRTKSFGDIARTRISQSIATLSVQIIGFKAGGGALLLGQTGGQGVGCIRLAKAAFTHQEFKSWTWGGVFRAAKRYRQFPIFSTWSGLFNSAGTQLPPLIFAALFSAGSAGLYGLAVRILKLPMTVMGGAVGKVYFSNLAKISNKSEFARQVEKGAIGLLRLSFPAAAAFMLFAPELFAFAFGSEWYVAGEIGRWITPWILFQFISSPTSVVYFVLEKEKVGLVFQVFMFSVRLISLVIGYLYLEFIGALATFAVVSAASYFIYIISILYLSGANIFLFVNSLLRESMIVVLALLPAILMYLFYNIAFALTFSIISLVVIYRPRIKSLYVANP